ncbi:hypothetical protein ACMZ4X_02770 [Achromobacter marplatensis]
MRACGLEFRKRILGAAGPSPSAALYGGAAFGYNQLASDMRRQAGLGHTGGVVVSKIRYQPTQLP